MDSWRRVSLHETQLALLLLYSTTYKANNLSPQYKKTAKQLLKKKYFICQDRLISVAYLHDGNIKTHTSVLDISMKALNLTSLRCNKTYSPGDLLANVTCTNN